MSTTTESDSTRFRKRRGTLLIVDDEDGARQSLRVIFKDDYDLLMAEDGPTAIELVQKNHVDAAVLDIRMAGMSGIEVLERIRFVNPNIEAIMITAFETTDTIRQALRLRACDYLNKPFDLATIRSAVSQAMQRRLASSQINSSTEKIRRLLDELQEQRAEEQIAKTRGDLYNQIFHDMNGSLTIISGFAQMVNERLNKNPDLRIELKDLEFIKDRMRIIARQTVSCIEITRRYRESIRYQPNESAPSVSINQLLKDLDQLVRLHPSLMENELVITPPVENVAAKIHGTYLIQILRNLAINALQCTPLPHRVEIGGETLREPLDLTKFKDNSNERLLYVETLENTAPLLKLWVRDNGPGIPPEVLPKIFQAYFTTKGPREGTGLGLNIVQRFIKEGNGALHCRTKSGEGTTFTIYLPGVELAKQT